VSKNAFDPRVFLLKVDQYERTFSAKVVIGDPDEVAGEGVAAFIESNGGYEYRA
jgi:hypothetical protein